MNRIRNIIIALTFAVFAANARADDGDGSTPGNGGTPGDGGNNGECDPQDCNYLGVSGIPRGIRNNNPGNLKITNIPWQGKINVSQNDDGTFEQFEKYWYGIRAMLKDLINDITQDGDNTLVKLITSYAPSSDNNPTTGYIAFVENYTGIDRNAIITPDYNTMAQIAWAIIRFENGEDGWITQELFDYVWNRL